MPADVDLRDFAFMPLDVQRLRSSDLAAMEPAEACWAALLLWCAAWHQVPAASLPDNDRVLASLAGYGRQLKQWRRVRAGALRGFLKADDGRLYHPVVAEKALEAWIGKLRQRLHGGAGNAKRWGAPFDRSALEASLVKAEQMRNAVRPYSAVLGASRPESPPPSPPDSPTIRRSVARDSKHGNRNNSSPTGAEAVAVHKNLVYPAKLGDGQRSTVDRIVGVLNDRDAQRVLDELDGAWRYGRKRIDDPIAFLISLTARCRGGSFVTSHAERVQAEREGRSVREEVAAARRIAA